MSNLNRCFHPAQGSYFLFGPRGVGKSTLLRQLYPSALWIDLLQPDLERSLLARPEKLSELIRAQPKATTVVIDEIQKAPGLLDVVHASIEERPALQFILTGSSSRKLKRTGVNLLGGRAIRKTLHPFMAHELQSKFSLTDALRVGMLPLVLGARDRDATLNAYVSLYVKEEVQAEGLVRNLAQFSRFLEVIAFSHGSIVNMNNIARESDAKRSSVANYLDILEDLLLTYRIPVFEKRAQRKLISHPKFYFFDCGVYRSLRPKGPLDHPNEIDGMALEGLVAQHLKAWCEYGSTQVSLHFWRTQAGAEVDFVLYGERCFYAIEVKNALTVSLQDLRGLHAFLEDYPEAKAILLYRGKDRLKIGKVLCVPVSEFLLELIPDTEMA